MTDSELELAILRKYVEHHDAVGTDAHKCARELDMREVVSNAIGRPADETVIKRWHARLAPAAPYPAGVLRPCSDSTKNNGPHRFHARAYFETGKTPAWERIAELESKLPPQLLIKDPLVFISYDTRDIDLAFTFASIIKRIFNDKVKTFIAKRDIKAGDDAFKTMLHDSLAKSAIVLAICTKCSLTSPWLWFESGAGFGTGTLIPIWAGVKPEKFKAPMAIFQGKSVEDKTEMKELITRIAEVTKVTASDYSLTAEEMSSLKQLTAKLKSMSVEATLNAADEERSNGEITKLNESITALKSEMHRADLKSSLAQFSKRIKKQITISDKQLEILRFIQNHEHISEYELIERFEDGDRLLTRHDIDELARLKFIKINRVDGVITDAAGRAYLVKKMNPSKTSDSK